MPKRKIDDIHEDYNQFIQDLNSLVLQTFVQKINFTLGTLKKVLEKNESMRSNELLKMQKLVSSIINDLKTKFNVPDAAFEKYYKAKIKPIQEEIDHRLSVKFAKRLNASERVKRPSYMLNAGPMTESDRYHKYDLKRPRGVSEADIDREAERRRESTKIKRIKKD